MADLLRLFEGKALHQALVDAGHEVSVRTVQRWCAGESAPRAQDMAAIRRVLELSNEAAPPAWAERLASDTAAGLSRRWHRLICGRLRSS